MHVEVEYRPGGRTLHVSELSTVFLDDHESWYAVHWTTQLRPSDFADFANQYLNIDGDTPTFLQTSEDTKSEPFSHQHADINKEDERAIRFVRIDVQDFVLNMGTRRTTRQSRYAIFSTNWIRD